MLDRCCRTPETRAMPWRFPSPTAPPRWHPVPGDARQALALVQRARKASSSFTLRCRQTPGALAAHMQRATVAFPQPVETMWRRRFVGCRCVDLVSPHEHGFS